MNVSDTELLLKFKSMGKFVISFLVTIVAATILSGCSSAKMNTVELKGLMLLDPAQMTRNRSHYSWHQANRIAKNHQKFHRKLKKKAFGNSQKYAGNRTR